MATWGATFVFVVFAFVHASARNFPSDQKTFFPCIPRNNIPNTPSSQQTFVHASAPLAESPTSDGFKDNKNFIYGGMGGFAGLGGYVGGLPLVGGIGKFGGIGGYLGLGGLDGGAGAGSAVLPSGLGGNVLLPCP